MLCVGVCVSLGGFTIDQTCPHIEEINNEQCHWAIPWVTFGAGQTTNLKFYISTTPGLMLEHEETLSTTRASSPDPSVEKDMKARLRKQDFQQKIECQNRLLQYVSRNKGQILAMAGSCVQHTTDT